MKSVMSAPELISENPCTGEIVWRGAIADAAQIDGAAKAARRAFASWAATPLAERIAIAERYRDLVKARADAFARVIAEETGKPLWEAHTEVASVAGKVDISVRACKERTGEARGPSGDFYQTLRHRPHGVLGVLGPYNFPAHLPNGHIVPALIAGNTVLFKPSELTPASAVVMHQLWVDAGLPDHVLQLVIGDGNSGRLLAAHDELDGLLFTGSARTGFALHRQFANAPHKILALEMGGNNPLLAWDVADMQAAASLVVASAYQSAGQRCTCARRLIVEDSKAGEQLVEALVALADRLIVGAPFDEPQPFCGPVIANAAADQLQSAAAQLLDRGARAIRAVRRPDPARPCLLPALIDVTGVDAPDEEMFGPVLQLVRVRDLEQAFAQMNATRFGLAAGLIGGDETLYNRFWQASRAGIVNWNRPLTGASSAAPFGGVGASGNHRPSAYYAADYCAWPVAGLEDALLRSMTLQGVRA